MLLTLRRIVQEVNAAKDLPQALDIIVKRVKKAMNVDVCSVYLFDPLSQQYVLLATEGLNPQSVQNVRLAREEGLVGLVGETEEPLNIDDASLHPRYRFIADTGEESYHGFLGVPIIHHRQVMGVLVVQHQNQRRFDDEEVSFLLTTAAQLSGAIAHAEVSGGIDGLADDTSEKTHQINALSGAPGVAVGTAVVVYPQADLDAVPDRRVEDVDAEIAYFHSAVNKVREEIQAFSENMKSTLSDENRAIFDAYLLMLGSHTLLGKTVERIQAGSWAAGALRDTINEYALLFDGMDDMYMRERSEDVRDLGRRILVNLQSGEKRKMQYPEKTILVGDEISATMLAEVPVELLAGVVSRSGSSFSHVSILAHALGIPAVVGASNIKASRLEGRQLVVDGYRGCLYLSPTQAIRDEYQRLAEEENDLISGLKELHDLPAETRDGIQVPLYANSGLLADITPAINSGASGIGLYRTEFPFMMRDRFPSEEEQRRIYRHILETFSPAPVTLRTLDIGGDKSLPYFPIVEDNPFLGWRGIRVTLDHPEIFLVQLRAMMKASANLNNMQLLLPMISNISEIDESLKLIARVHRELIAEGEPVIMPRIGIMIEVPSAIYLIESLASRVDYFSVGTNDLTQYLLAVDRNNSRVASLYDALHPAVLGALMDIVSRAHRHNKPVSICGEMAGDPAASLLLLGMGVDSLSMSAASLPRVKWMIRNFTMTHARAVLDKALSYDNAEAIRYYLNKVLEEAGLGGLIRAGK